MKYIQVYEFRKYLLKIEYKNFRGTGKKKKIYNRRKYLKVLNLITINLNIVDLCKTKLKITNNMHNNRVKAWQDKLESLNCLSSIFNPLIPT